MRTGTRPQAATENESAHYSLEMGLISWDITCSVNGEALNACDTQGTHETVSNDLMKRWNPEKDQSWFTTKLQGWNVISIEIYIRKRNVKIGMIWRKTENWKTLVIWDINSTTTVQSRFLGMLLETTAKTQTKLTIYTATQKFGVGRCLVFYVFERSPLCLPQLNQKSKVL